MAKFVQDDNSELWQYLHILELYLELGQNSCF